MSVNVEFLIVAYIVGLFVDWVFQSNWQATNKSKWGKGDNYVKSAIAVISHAWIYAWLTSEAVFFLCNLTRDQYYNILGVFWITHAIIDTRIPVKYIMRFKGMKESQINDYTNFGFMHIGIDHRLHELVILILSIVI